jgi:hypothetical protein
MFLLERELLMGLARLVVTLVFLARAQVTKSSSEGWQTIS